MYSLVSAKAGGVEPFAQASQRQPVTSAELDDLLPDCWLMANFAKKNGSDKKEEQSGGDMTNITEMSNSHRTNEN